MNEKTVTEHQAHISPDGNDPPGISLRGFSTISATSTALGVLAVFLLNASTPIDFIRDRLTILIQQTGLDLVVAVLDRLVILLGITAVASGLSALAMHLILRPVSRCLGMLKAGGEPPAEWVKQAGRRLINLPFIMIGVNVGMWIVLPLIFFISASISEYINTRTAVIFSIRAFMVGLIASSLAFYKIESHARKKIIPFFFPRGRLAELEGTARMPISRRLRMFFRLGTVVPGTILLVTLLTLQLDVDPDVMSAREYARGIVYFTLVLSLIFFVITGILNRLVSRSIVEPLNEMLSKVAAIRQGDYSPRIQVVSNDEIGVLGDAGNRMIRGLADREMIRTAFGKYVTPEIRDEILSGRIPLQGERRVATVLFADLRNFTPFVESNPPEEVISSMRAYFTAMHQAIREHRGLVVQFVGDEIEAVFGIPIPFEDHAEAALEAALGMRQALERLNKERASEGKPPFAHGIGIHSGDVLAGNSGSSEQSAYALIGDTVNVASRIQGLTKELGCDILISHETLHYIKNNRELEEYPQRMVKGYSKPVIVHRVIR
jgi:adenylate cyclase